MFESWAAGLCNLCSNHLYFVTDESRFGKLVDEYLHDFDIFQLGDSTELLHHIDPKYLSVELGGSRPADLDTWMVVQQNVDAFSLRYDQHSSLSHS